MGRDAAHSLPFRDEGGAALPSACGLRHLPRLLGGEGGARAAERSGQRLLRNGQRPAPPPGLRSLPSRPASHLPRANAAPAPPPPPRRGFSTPSRHLPGRTPGPPHLAAGGGQSRRPFTASPTQGSGAGATPALLALPRGQAPSIGRARRCAPAQQAGRALGAKPFLGTPPSAAVRDQAPAGWGRILA